MSAPRWIVGIDLAPAAMRSRAPGTARLVEEQARALLKLDVPWRWAPVLSPLENPLAGEVAHLNPVTGRHTKPSLHATLEVGRLWRQAGCTLGFATAFFVPFNGPPVVANYFDANFFEPVDAWHRRTRAPSHLWMRSLMWHSVQRAKTLFILSDYGRRKMASVFPRHAHKFVVTPCGIRTPGAPAPQPPAWASGLKRPFFLYVGSFSDNKNQRTLLDAWRLLQSRHADAPGLVLIGPASRAYMDTVIAPRHRTLPRPQDVLLPGFTAEAELNWAYWNAAGYVQPSFAEGFGMPVLEAMSCGLPTACSDSTSLPETAGDAALLFDPRDVESMARAVETIWQDAATRESLIYKGRARAALFTWEKNANRVAEGILAHLRRLP
jgi:glycosyltransferase involved in cell wall biosynthesis